MNKLPSLSNVKINRNDTTTRSNINVDNSSVNNNDTGRKDNQTEVEKQSSEIHHSNSSSVNSNIGVHEWIVPVDSRVEFWYKMICLLDAFGTEHLTETEKRILVYAIITNAERPFVKAPRKVILKELRMKEQVLSMYKGTLFDKGWVTSDGKLSQKLVVLRTLNKERIASSFAISFELTLRKQR